MGVNRRSRSNVGYGLDNALQGLAPQPIISNRAPTTNDSAELGTVWIDKSENNYYILTSVYAGSANWEVGGSSGIFLDLEVTGNSTFDGPALFKDDVTQNAGDYIFSSSGTFSVAPTNTGSDSFVVNTLGGIQTLVTKDILMTSGANTATAFQVQANGGTSAKASLLNTTGTATDSIYLQSTAGGIKLQAPALKGVTISNGTQAPGIFVGTGDPNTVVTAPQGSLYMNVAGSGVANRLWVNSDGVTAWVAVSTVS